MIKNLENAKLICGHRHDDSHHAYNLYTLSNVEIRHMAPVENGHNLIIWLQPPTAQETTTVAQLMASDAVELHAYDRPTTKLEQTIQRHEEIREKERLELSEKCEREIQSMNNALIESRDRADALEDQLSHLKALLVEAWKA